MHYIVCFLSFFMSCFGEHNDAHFENSPNIKLKEKLAIYCEKSRPIVASRGWAVDECDGLLFKSLWSIGCGEIDGVRDFEDTVEPGKWYRNPKHDCYVADKVGDQGSDSTISKDQYIGLTSYLFASKNSQALKRTIDYGKSHDWIVGEAKDSVTLFSKCLITPSLQSIISDSYRRLNDIAAGKLAEDSVVGIQNGFRGHLQVLAILLRGKIDGKIGAIDSAILREQAKRQPNNGLFQAAKARYDDGDFSSATDILLDERKFPAEELPSNKNYCTEYLWQRDESHSDWDACDGQKTYDGTDFVFAASIINGNF